ncbi:ATP-dependent helicase [Pseudomonas sp. W15Feb9B]|uniref:ATP-dependent helicase n=1 Tax=Pseudomonas sp. W15Feb9B TaxID=550743 RepID=UPI0005975089|nr:ATP-dependent helicase [Pseudomonas sp. W15Feb9B]KIK83081.1 DNA helicase UvrD [Pseudomonas sp. W15Feb9B]
MSDRTAYLSAAEGLRANPGQWAAYESRGHCVVLAGPGSGKTKTLTTKMARLLAEDVAEPRGIACITFNNECARELENRLSDLGVEAGGRVFIGTVHSFSLTQIILPYAKVAKLGLPDEFTVAAKSERAQALRIALEAIGENPESLGAWEFRMNDYRRKILDRNSRDWLEMDPGLARLAEAYEEQLRVMHLIDYDDMPLLALKALRENEWLRSALLAKYPVLIIDEYQDLGSALHRMVLGLCFTAGLRLFAVGDPDQSIYGFNGARPDLLRRLSERPGVETVRLRLNYRCATRIVAASGTILGEARDYEAVSGAPPGEVYFHPLWGRYEHQATTLINELIPQALARHPQLRLGDVAILYPAAWLGDTLIPAIQQAGLPYIRTDNNALYPRSSRLMQWLEQCAKWCCGGWHAGTPLFSRLASDGRRLFSEIIQSDEQTTDFHRQLISKLWATRDETTSLLQWLVDLRTHLLAPLGGKCSELRDELTTLAQFIDRISPGGDSHGMCLGDLAGQGEGPGSLNLSSLHSAKGREFALVFMFGIDVGRLPRAGDMERELAEARRLFYVGLTRAKTEIHLVHTNGRASEFVRELQQRIEAGT